jgi:hypothetical protein
MYFLSEEETRFFEALCETIVPADSNPKEGPGALTVGAISYIDSTLFEFPKETQQYFRRALGLLNEKCRQDFSKSFADLDHLDKNLVLRDFFLEPTTREMAFDLRSIVLEAFYSDYHDPSYEGITAWDYAGFAGKRITGLKKDWSFLKVWRDREKTAEY